MTTQQRIQWRQRNEILQSMTARRTAVRKSTTLAAVARDAACQTASYAATFASTRWTERSRATNQIVATHPAFMQGLNPDERGMLPYLSRLRVGSAPEAPTGPPEILISLRLLVYFPSTLSTLPTIQNLLPRAFSSRAHVGIIVRIDGPITVKR